MKRLSFMATAATRQRGSVLVFCMVLAGVGAIGTAAFFSLIRAKSMETMERETALIRRIRLANSRALAKEAILRNYLGASTALQSPNQTLTLDSNWGEAVISPFPTPPLSADSSIRFHKTGAVPQFAFNQDILLTLWDGEVANSFVAQAKSAHPALLGDLLVFHQTPLTSLPPVSVNGSLIVDGRTVFLPGSYAAPGTGGSGFRTERAIIASTTGFPIPLASPANSLIVPDNFPLPPMTTGVRSSVGAFNHHLLVVDNSETVANSYVHKIQTHSNSIILSGAVPAAVSDGATGDFSRGSSAAPPGGPYSPAVYSVLCQAAEAERLIQSAAYAALALGSTVNFSYTHVPSGSTPFSNWWTDAKTFTGSDPSGVNSDLTAGLQQIRSDLTSAMSALGGPAPNTGSWWPPDVPPLTDDLFWMNNNPYLGSTGSSPLWELGVAGSDGNGTVQIKVGDPGLSHVLIRSNVRKLVLTGQDNAAAETAAEANSPIMIVVNAVDIPEGCNQRFKLQTIEFQGSNRRRTVVAIRQNDALNTINVVCTGGNAFPQWHGMLELESVPLSFDTTAVSEITLVGGIRTDRSITVARGSVRLSKETVQASIQTLLARSAWLEMFDLP